MSHLVFSEIGLWHAGVSPRFNFNQNVKEKISFHQSKRVIKIVAVVQPPFIYEGIYYMFDIIEKDHRQIF